MLPFDDDAVDCGAVGCWGVESGSAGFAGAADIGAGVAVCVVGGDFVRALAIIGLLSIILR